MKALKFFLLIASVGVLFTFSNCGGGGSTSEPITDQQLGKLVKTWKLTSVTLAGNAVTTPSYTGFQLAITGTKGQTSFNYTTSFPSTRPLSAWKSSGTWKFGTEPTTMITRDAGTADELAMTYVVSGTTLQINFNYTGGGYSTRTDQVEGAWVFNFTAQ
jgi:hypothetical protein